MLYQFKQLTSKTPKQQYFKLSFYKLFAVIRSSWQHKYSKKVYHTLSTQTFCSKILYVWNTLLMGNLVKGIKNTFHLKDQNLLQIDSVILCTVYCYTVSMLTEIELALDFANICKFMMLTDCKQPRNRGTNKSLESFQFLSLYSSWLIKHELPPLYTVLHKYSTQLIVIRLEFTYL